LLIYRVFLRVFLRVVVLVVLCQVTLFDFYKKYDSIEEELLDAKLAEKLPSPVWMNEKGEVVSEESKAIGCKVTSKLTRPDMCIVMDEVGCNLSNLKDGHAGGKKFVCDVNDEPKTLSTKRDKHFTCLGLTLLSGEPLMCVVIVDAKREDLLVRTGNDVLCDEIPVPCSTTNDPREEGEEKEKPEEDEFTHLENNLGKGKQYPGGPVCTYKNITIPCLVEFTPGGGMTADILTKIFETIDTLQLFHEDRENGLRPFLLLDGHHTRFDIKFLSYMNSPAHRWSVCIGVPYGTALWQVGDSKQQNGQFKVRIAIRKQHILQVRIDTIMQMELVPTDIIPLVNYGWAGSFANVHGNKEAICKRGWFPLNRNLLLHDELRCTMTDQDVETERNSGLCPSQYLYTPSLHSSPIPPSTNTVSPTTTTTTTTTNPNINSSTTTTSSSSLNYCSGIATTFVTRIIKHHELEIGREKLISDRKKGDIMKKRMNETSKPSAALLVIENGTHVLGQELTADVKMRIEKQRKERMLKKQKIQETQVSNIIEADKVINRNKGKAMMKWTLSDLKTVVRAVKNRDDGAMPTKKKALCELYLKCKNRIRLAQSAVPSALDDVLLTAVEDVNHDVTGTSLDDIIDDVKRPEVRAEDENVLQEPAPQGANIHGQVPL
jgi:hypothetical protein